MPTDPSTDTAPATSRRTFLARSAAGGALVSAAALASPVRSLLPVAGAQDGAGASSDLGSLSDADFAALTTPLELAAVQVYQVALGGETGETVLDEAWTERARSFQDHHATVAEALTPLLGSAADAPVPGRAFLARYRIALGGAADQNAVLTVLADLEETLSATHLLALETMSEAITAKTVAQVLTVEGQHAVLLSSAAGVDPASLTPSPASTAAAAQNQGVEPEPEPEAGSEGDAEPTTTTTAQSQTEEPTTTAPDPGSSGSGAGDISGTGGDTDGGSGGGGTGDSNTASGN